MTAAVPNTEWSDYRVMPGRGIELLHAHFTRHVYERHAHDSYALGITEDGVQSFTYRGSYHASTRGTAIVLLPGEIHDGHSGAPEGFTYRMLYIDPAEIAGAVEDALDRPAHLPFLAQPLVRDRRLARLIRELHRALAATTSTLERDTLVSEVAIALATRHADDPVRPREPCGNHQALRRVRDFLEGEFAGDISAADVARVAGMSRFHLSREFRRVYGSAPHVYLLQVRLKAARSLLARGESAAAVAAATGFADQSHLNKRFKGAFGITPGQFARAAGATR